MSLNVIEAAQATLRAAMATPELDTGTRAFDLLEVFITKTKERLDAGVTASDLQFTKQDLAIALGIKTDSDSQRKEINRLLKDLSAKLKEFRPAIQNRLLEANYRETIAIDESTEGRRKYVFLKAIPLEVKEPSTSSLSTPNLIHYEPISEKSIFRLNTVELNIRSGFIFIGILVFPWMALVISILYDAFISDIQLIKVLSTLMMLPFIILILPFISLFEKGLVLAPWWLKPTLYKTTFLTLVHSESNRTNRLKIVLRSYKAKCPICDGHLNIRKGKHQFKGRFIGQCEITNEHSYTFDHVRERGVPAHTPMYIPRN